MPELPEVETVIRYLRPHLVGRSVKSAYLSPKGHRIFGENHISDFDRLTNATFNSISRYGKWMLFDLSTGPAVAHLRMSGIYEITDQPLQSNPHTRFHLSLDNGKHLNYIDQRRFGTFHFTDSFETYLGARNLGPDALSNEFHVNDLYPKLQKKTKNIYSTLLDQTVVAGLGNIYVNEVLHKVGLHPLRPANQVTKVQAEQIVLEAKKILELALDMKGTSLVDNLYRNPEGGSGEFYKMLEVYGKKDDPDIEVLKIGGRSAFVHKLTPKP